MYAALGRAPLGAAIGVQQAESLAGGVYEAALDAEQVPRFPPRLRATLLSLQSALQSGFVAVLFPVLGWLFQGGGGAALVFLCVALLAALGAALWKAAERPAPVARRGERAAP
jgi:hypothetical protein